MIYLIFIVKLNVIKIKRIFYFRSNASITKFLRAAFVNGFEI